MKKKSLFFALLSAVLLTATANAQDLSSYTVETNTVTYVSIASTGTRLTSVYGDYNTQTLPLPFAFEFGMRSIAQGATLRVRSDGHVLINLTGTWVGNDMGYNYWPVNTSRNYCAIVPYSCDDGYLPNSSSAGAYWLVEEDDNGDSVFVLEFLGLELYEDNGEVFNYQLRIFQNGNISVTYGAMTGSTQYANFMMTANDTYDRVLLTGSWDSPVAGCPAQMSYLAGAPSEGTVITYVRPTSFCPRPQQLMVSNLLSDEATVQWTGSEQAYVYEYDTVDFIPGSGEHNMGTAYDTSVYLGGLTHSTTYYFYVRSDCGSDTSNYASFTFRTACGSIADFPWEEGFESADALACWSILDLDGSTSDNWQRYSSSTNSHSGSYSARSSYNTSTAANDWLVTPPLEIPSDADGYVIKWHAKGVAFSSNQAHYTVLLSTSGASASAFTDTLFAENGTGSYVERTASLDSYAGQTVNIAFVHDSHNDNGLYIDDVSVYSAMMPVVSIAGPVRADEGSATVFRAVVAEGASSAMQYSWTSSMEAAGHASTVADGDSLQVIYSAGGTDTVSLVATNAFGSDTATILVQVCGSVSSIPWLEDFSSSSALECWTVYDYDASTSDNWVRVTSGGLNGSAAVRSYYNSSAAANDWLVTPSITFPSDASGLVLGWYVKGSQYSGNVAHYTVRLSTSGADTASFADTLFAESYSGDFASRSVSLDAFAGQSVRIAFVHDSYNDNGLTLDDISVRSAVMPLVSLAGPTSAFTNEPVAFAATLLEGSTSGLTYTWSSTLGGTLSPNADSVVIVYSTGGTDTVSVIATNAFGADTATAVVQVVDCAPIASLPWTEGFEGSDDDLACWMMLDLDGNTNDNWTRYSSGTNNNSGSYSMRSYYNSSAAANDWLVTPQITVPSDADGLVVSWFVKGTTYSSNVSHYTVRLSTSGSDTASFTDSLFAEAYSGPYVSRSVSLDAYAGQNVRIAFIHDSHNDNGLYLDDIAVRYSSLPSVTLDAPTSVFTGETVRIVATLSEGSTSGLSYSWSNTLASSTLSPNSDTLEVVYSAGGIDTVSVIAINAFGADTAWAVIGVIDCSPITSFPWTEDFEGGSASLYCWRFVDNNNFADDDWMVGSTISAYDGTYCLAGRYHEYGSCDDYVISPAFAIPADATGLRLSYYVAGGSYVSNTTSYSTLVSTSGSDLADFTDTLIAETYGGDYVRRSFSLEPYAGQTIHFAFHQTSYDADNMYIDNISIAVGDDEPEPACDAPEIVSVSESETAVTITFSGTAVTYSVAIVAGSWSAPAQPASTLSNTYTFSNLTPGTAYVVGVRGTCADGTFSDWTTQTVTTASASCATPTGLSISDVGYTAVTVAWDADPAGPQAWEINVHCNSPVSDSIVAATASPVTIQGLQPGRSYSVTVRALCSAGTHSPWSAAQTFTTNSCSTPTGLQLASLSTTSASIAWNATGADAYEVNIGGEILVVQTAAALLDNLTPGTAYDVVVRALCTDNVASAWTSVLHFVTQQVGIDAADFSAFELFPNPATSMVTLQGLVAGDAVTVVDLHGRTVASFQANDNAMQLDVSAFARGLYFVRVTGGASSSVRKLVLTE